MLDTILDKDVEPISVRSDGTGWRSGHQQGVTSITVQFADAVFGGHEKRPTGGRREPTHISQTTRKHEGCIEDVSDTPAQQQAEGPGSTRHAAGVSRRGIRHRMSNQDDQYRVLPSDDGARLDKLVARIPSVGSRSRARSAIETGKVRIDGSPADPRGGALPVGTGAMLSVEWTARGTNWNRAKAERVLEDAGLAILHQDDHVVAINKPPGMLTDTATRKQARERDSVRKRLHEWLTHQGQAAHVVHRIDRDTSGVVLLARDASSADDLRNQFRERAPLRRYQALVWGIPDTGMWVDWMSWDRRHRKQVVRKESASGASRASAEARVLAEYDRFASEIEVTLESGRRNQIRLQAQLRGCPLVGETQYIEPGFRPRWRVQPTRQMLHAAVLEVRHPSTGRRLRVEAPIPADYERTRAALRNRSGAPD